MAISRRRLLALGIATLGLAGCGGADPTFEEASYPSNQPTGIALAKQILEGYARGEPVGSEAAGAYQMVEDAKREDPAKGEIIERGFAEIRDLMNQPAKVPEKAKAILAELEK